MLYVVRFIDWPDRQHTRAQFRAEHIGWLETHKDTILVAGSLRPEHGDDAVGGLWVVEAKDKPTIEVLLQSDPFWVHGLRQSYEILH